MSSFVGNIANVLGLIGAGMGAGLAKSCSKAASRTDFHPKYEYHPNKPWKQGGDGGYSIPFSSLGHERAVQFQDRIKADAIKAIQSPNFQFRYKFFLRSGAVIDPQFVRPEEVSFEISGTFPRTPSEYKNIFGEHPTARQFQSVTKSRQKFENKFSTIIDADTKRFKTASSREEFLEIMHSSRSKNFFFVGHSDHGSILFPDGSKLKLTDASKACRANNKNCILFSCETSKYLSADEILIDRKVSYEDAYFVFSKFAKAFEAKQPVSFLETTLDMQAHLNQLLIKRKKRAGVRVIMASGTISLVVIEVYSENSQHSESQRQTSEQN